MKIGELAKRSGCSIQTIRYYEKEGLISAPARSDGNFRLYDTTALEKLSFIKNCRALDLTLGEIKHLIALQYSPGTPCEVVNDMIDAHLHIVETRITDLQNLQSDLKRLRHKCGRARSIDQCGILNELSPKSQRRLVNNQRTSR
jgi:Cd(II)/Pb(II)-responsive transcriptional regulator